MAVGRSDGRTKFKHFLLDALLGRINGALTTGKTAATPPLLCVDLCAGDGLETEQHRASPLIFQKHCNHPCGRKNDARLVLIERERPSFDLLKQNVGNYPWIELRHGDARNFTLPQLDTRQAVFIHCDPNNAHQTPLTSDFVGGFTECTTYLATLGCNASGIKRLPLDQRECWFDYVQMLIRQLSSWHDAILFWLVNDKAQWAYLCNVPIKWRDETIHSAINSKAAKEWEKGVGGVSLRHSKSKFEHQLNRLFLTKDELDGQLRLF